MVESLEIKIETISEIHIEGIDNHASSSCHNYYSVIWIDKGEISIIIDFISVQALGPEILFIGENRTWSISEVKGGSSGYVIRFSQEYFCRKAADVRLLQRTIVFDVTEFFRLPLMETEEVATIMSLLYKEYRGQKEFCHEIIRQQLSSLILLSERTIEKRSINNYLQQEAYKYTRMFKRLIDEHYVEFKSVNKYTKLMCISHKHLIACVSKVTCTTPKQLLNKRIMAEAKRLLVYCSWNIKEIGIHLGFKEETNFTKFFKKESGVTPLQYRNGNHSFQ